jgi:CubicO group peptidase (beta-lactamase class C family)
MTSTYVTNLTPDNPRLAVGYGRRTPDGKRADGVFTDCKGITPAANIATTVEDLARFAMLQMRSGPAGGAQILSGNTLEEMHRVHWLDPDWKAGWGIGFRVERREDKTIFGHGGSLQGYRTQLAINPEEKLAVIVMTNADDGNPDLYVEKALKWVFPALAKVAAPAKKPVSAEKKYKALCGRYRNLWGDTQVMVYNGELVMIDPAETDPIPDMVHLDTVGENKFRMTSKNGYSSNGEMAEFELDEKGHVTRLITGMSYSFPVKKW